MRLLRAAFSLMAEKGRDNVAISEITEAADVGFGSFYYHFESKDGIFAALTEWVFDDFADGLERLASGLSDPAEVVSVCVRHTLMRARRERLWGQFLMREGFSVRALDHGLGQRLRRDSERGIAARRFVVGDPFVSVLAMTGTILAAIAAACYAADTAAGGARKPVGDEDRLPERAAAMVLQTLGLARAEAKDVANRPLPPGDFTTAESS
ncbi:TetR/AcrR family transcriptional regulator [Burkholderia ubonensis]|uniref:TetR/AcrR family transcriptional regulator n=1 Tax=Burkholderia ubonensis TaxID=101571 RepID=A0AB74D2U2_9BURK|nr:TetR/AcrR family transcriptional regulator [Burkholderia ubonensis]PAJ78346.1 TetR family transcriptional regulator [Burkholderia ubonensis]PAJ89544.1 TetR family transcriptional regulator [Burkholderia ubonensis]PAJ95951.1 TetR family transcriptional regulator [Burkholderia ubonensis]PAJ98765.1 TetR family transcriptional regulator [Burkholderia ubonensis]PAK03567.1 TetR family transcriptional regulator [Burkholderia ubonensis]